MDMTLSKRGDYVMRAAILLARSYEQGAPRKIREVVAETEVPRTFASQILADLVRARLARSRAGRDGGYWLARPPAQISVLEVIEAAEGPLRPERCALGEGPCRWGAVCPLHESLSAATDRLTDLLAKTTLAELAARDAAIEAGVDPVPADTHRAYPRSVEVGDRVRVGRSADAAEGALAARSARLGSVVGAAWRDVAGSVAGSGSSTGGGATLVAECSLEPIGPSDGGAPGRFVLAWRLSGPGGTSHFDGTLSVQDVAPGFAQLEVTGSWHQDVDGGAPRSGADLERLARAVTRATLERLGRWVELSVRGSHGTTDEPAPAPAGASPPGAPPITAGAAKP